MTTYNLFDMGANSGIGMTSNAGWNTVKAAITRHGRWRLVVHRTEH
jgi:hypothetical protein